MTLTSGLRSAAFFTFVAVVVCAAAVHADDGLLPSAATALERTTERGPVTATVRLTPPQPRIGDALTLTLEVKADEGVELLMPEFGRSLERFPIVDFMPRESIADDGRTIASQKYTLRTLFSGDAVIPPLLVEFVDHREGNAATPEGEDAYELLTERMTFEIAGVVPTDASSELRPPLSELPLLRTPARTTTALVSGKTDLCDISRPLLNLVNSYPFTRGERQSASGTFMNRLKFQGEDDGG
jgi:hypothetical protein